ncbi:MAG: recombinase family protein, partial [Candidatus Hydrogenedentes bacterium]|nr:recombinase family protein [Candidatus Hydrogenedentota bacterium]
MRGKRGKAERGLYPAGKAPYGYRLDEDALGGLAVDDHQAKVVRRIFDLYSGGESIYGVVAALTREGARTYSGKSQWAKSTVKRILDNETYVGKLIYNRTRRNGRGREIRDPEEWIQIKVNPIVD